MTDRQGGCQAVNRLLGVPVGPESLQGLVEKSIAAVDSRHLRFTFACANPHSLVQAQHDDEFRQALCTSSAVVADGVGVTLIARVLSIDVGPRITGTDYFFSLLSALAERGHGRIFFFGSSPFVLARIEERFRREYPMLTLCGSLSPPFREWSNEENEAMLADINAAQPDILWVGMTAPKQEKWVSQNARRLNAKVIGSIGAVFDFYAGTYPRAPHWICSFGLEWAYRLLREPRRMWRRTFVSGPRYLAQVVRQHVLS